MPIEIDGLPFLKMGGSFHGKLLVITRGYHKPSSHAHRNRWFTVLKNGWIFHGKLLVITRGYHKPSSHAHRNRWFTVLENGWIFPWQTVSHNQRVSIKLRWSARSVSDTERGTGTVEVLDLGSPTRGRVQWLGQRAHGSRNGDTLNSWMAYHGKFHFQIFEMNIFFAMTSVWLSFLSRFISDELGINKCGHLCS